MRQWITLSRFSMLTVDQLKAFIAARQYPDKERYVTPPGNKGTLKEAQDGIMKMILFAYTWRQQSITIIEHQDEQTNLADSEESLWNLRPVTLQYYPLIY